MNETKLARKYISKANSARSRGIEFELSFSEYKKLIATKRCKYSNRVLQEGIAGIPTSFDTRTIDRIDSSKGYVTGNVVAACSGVNSLKGIWENPNNPLDINMVQKILDKIEEVNE